MLVWAVVERAGHIEAIQRAGGRVYEVGGVVRDRLLGLAPKDADYLVTKLPAAKLIEILKPFGSVHGVGQSFGVVKFRPRGTPAEVPELDFALPRRERSTGPGHRDFDVDFDPEIPVEEDLKRRDFTVNAMAQDLADGRIVDPFGGRADLEKRVLRIVFPNAFVDDPLRILRGIQFAARFGLAAEPETLASMTANAERITTVSGERIAQELKKLLLSPKPSIGFYLMRDIGLLAFLLPELHALIGVTQPGKKDVGDAFDHTLRVLDASRSDRELENAGDLTLMLAALFHDLGKATTRKEEGGRVTFHGHQFVSRRLTERRLKALRVEQIGVDPKEIATLVENHMYDTGPDFTDKAVRRFANKIGLRLVFMQIDLRIADNRGGAHPNNIRKPLAMRKRIREELEKKAPFGLKDLAITGADLLAQGYAPGPKLGEKLKELLDLVLDEPELNTREELLKRI